MKKFITAFFAVVFSLNLWAQADFSQIRINEVSGVGEHHEIFYELINLGTQPVNLEGFRIYYNANGERGQSFPPNDNRLTWTGTSADVIQPGGLLLLQGRATAGGVLLTGLTAQRILIITLTAPNGEIIDQCIRARDDGMYDIRNRSFSRIPDGTGAFYFTTPTPNASNGTSTAGLIRVPQTPIGGGESGDFYNHPVFDINALPVITIEVSVSEWNRLLTNFDLNSHNGERVRGDFVFSRDGVEQRVSNIGFRYRGNTSRRRPEGNYGELHNPNNPLWRNVHWNINFRYFERDQRFHGLRRLTLKWHKDDAAFCREIYAFDLFRRFGVWTAPRASYARVYVKVGDRTPAYFGVYAMIEHVDVEYVRARQQFGFFETSTGNLWQARHRGGANGGPADLTLNNARNKMGIEIARLDESQSERFTYDLVTNNDNLEAAKDEFYAWLTNLNTLTGDAFKTWITNNFDVDLFLRTYAVNVVLGQWDGYWGNGNNFFLYFESNSGRAFFIPWDYDNILGTSLFFDSGRENVLRWGGRNKPLIDKILAIPEFREQYLIYLNELIHPENDLFHIDRSIPRIQAWHDMIRNYIRPETIETSETSHSIIDRPASWGNMPNYRLLERGSNNFFEVRAANIPFREIPSNLITTETKNNQSLIVYPNPVTDGIFFVELPAGKSSETVKIFDLSGRLVLAQAVALQKNGINISHLSNGMYIVKVFSDEGRMTGSSKIVKK